MVGDLDRYGLGIDRDDPAAHLRIQQAEADLDLIVRLRNLRKARGLSQKTIARRMGRDQAVVSNLERLGGDPRMSSIRRYANALGVVVEHTVHEPSWLEENLPIFDGENEEIASLADDARILLDELKAQC